jgi:thiol:disulfide interchange protein DsbC
MEMKRLKIALAALFFLSTCAFADVAQDAVIKKLVEVHLGPEVKVDTVTKTPYGGLFEIRVGNDILYTDEKVSFIVFGNIIDTATSTNITKARIEDINKIKFADLPLDSAVKMVKGNGKRVIAVFEDPNCGYCKHLRRTLQTMDNITVYTFMYNILAADSATKSKNVWCAPDRLKAWDEWMLNGKPAPTAPASCSSTPNDKISALGRKLNVTATPTIFFADGTRTPGALDEKGLEARLAMQK